MKNSHESSYEKRILDLKIANLQAFVCVAEAGSFSTAAKQLFLTQPSISRRIAALESLLETHLFDRLGNHVLLTEAGKILLPKAKHILLATENAQKQLQNLNGHVSGDLQIGVSGYIAESYLRPILQSFTKKYPDVKLEIRLFGSSAHAYSLLETSNLDLLIATIPIQPIEHLNIIPIWEDPLLFVVSNNHPLSKQTKLQLKSLAKYPAIIPEAGTSTRQIIDDCFAGKNLKLTLASQIPKPANFQIIKMMVSLGLGWSVLPKQIIDKTFFQLDIKKAKLTRYLGVIHHQSRTLSNAANALIDIFKTHRNIEATSFNAWIVGK